MEFRCFLTSLHMFTMPHTKKYLCRLKCTATAMIYFLLRLAFSRPLIANSLITKMAFLADTTISQLYLEYAFYTNRACIFYGCGRISDCQTLSHSHNYMTEYPSKLEYCISYDRALYVL